MRRDEAMLERLADLAREDEPPPLEPDEARRMVGQATIEAAARQRPHRATRRSNPAIRRPRRLAWMTGAAVAAAIALGIWGGTTLLRPAGDTDVAERPLQMTLPTGDALLASAGADFRLESTAPAHRRIQLERGTMLFDVAPLDGTQRFDVVTPHLKARALGTVFSVETTEETSVVRVYEGEVEVRERDGRVRRVLADRSLRSGDEVKPMSRGPLEDEARQAAASRRIAPPPPKPEKSARSVAAKAATEEPQEPGPPVTHRPRTARGSATADRSGNHPRPEPPTVVEARAWITTGRSSEALRAAGAALARGAEPGPWRMVQADALRALRRFPEAAAAYDRAAADLSPAEAAQAGYLAATLKHRRLGDPTGALHSLDRTDADGAASPLAERAAALRTRVLFEAGRRLEARRAAVDYLARFPNGGMVPWMREVVHATGASEALQELP